MENYYEKAMKALQLAGMSKSNKECYPRSIRQIVSFYYKTSDPITDTELEDYFLHRQNEDQCKI